MRASRGRHGRSSQALLSRETLQSRLRTRAGPSLSRARMPPASQARRSIVRVEHNHSTVMLCRHAPAARRLNLLGHASQAHHPPLDFTVWITIGEPFGGHAGECLLRQHLLDRAVPFRITNGIERVHSD